jgi:hypothetical protein
VGLETFFGKQNSPLDNPPPTAAATAATTPVGSPQVEERATNSSHTTPSTSSRDLKNAAKVKQYRTFFLRKGFFFFFCTVREPEGSGSRSLSE